MIDIFQPLRIFTAEEYQLRYRQSLLNYRPVLSLYVDRRHLLPFCVRRIKQYSDLAGQKRKIDFTTIQVQNIHNSNIYNILNNLAFDYQFRSDDLLEDNEVYDYAFYRGASTITALPQGEFQLYLVDEDSNEFYSEIFRIGFPQFTVKFEYKNSRDFNDLCFANSTYYFKMEFSEVITYSSGDYDEFKSIVQDNEYHEILSYGKADKLMSVNVLMDEYLLDAAYLMKFCDTIYITNELNVRNRIKITEIVNNGSTKGGHADIDIRYYIVNNTLKSIKQTFTSNGGVDGTDPIVKDYGVYRGPDRIYRGGRKIIRKKE